MAVHNTVDKLSIDVRHLGLSLHFSIEGVQWVSVEESRQMQSNPLSFLYANGSAMLVSAA
jgi:hypothetical protein